MSPQLTASTPHSRSPTLTRNWGRARRALSTFTYPSKINMKPKLFFLWQPSLGTFQRYSQMQRPKCCRKTSMATDMQTQSHSSVPEPPRKWSHFLIMTHCTELQSGVSCHYGWHTQPLIPGESTWRMVHTTLHSKRHVHQLVPGKLTLNRPPSHFDAPQKQAHHTKSLQTQRLLASFMLTWHKL